MILWFFAVALALTMPAQAYARVAPVPPHYASVDDAVARSEGFWRLTQGTSERRVRADAVGLACIERAGDFAVVWLSMPQENEGYCSYSRRRPGPTLVIYVNAGPVSTSLEELARREAARSGRHESRVRNIGRCRGVLMRTTFDPAEGRYPNGRAWRTSGRHDIVYVVHSPTRALEVRLLSEGPPPYYESDAEVIRIAETSMDCQADQRLSPFVRPRAMPR
jgi:hypothetical protein